jgi:hypothetical protein
MGGLIQDEYAEQRFAIMQNSVSAVFEGFARYCKNADIPGSHTEHGDILSGIIYLAPQDAKELKGIIRAYLDAHETVKDDGEPWEYALITYPVKEK